MRKAKRVDPAKVKEAMTEAGFIDDGQAEAALADLAVELGVAGVGDIRYGEGRTPYGKRYMAGAANTGVVTHFWDDDDGWQRMPEPFVLGDG